MVGRGLRRMAAEMRLELLPVGQFDDEALESFVVEFRAGRVLNADAPGDRFLAQNRLLRTQPGPLPPGPRTMSAAINSGLALCASATDATPKARSKAKEPARLIAILSSFSTCASTTPAAIRETRARP
jgi:hypothetical protein